MALLFNSQPPAATWAFNHQYFRFQSDLAFTPANCEVTVEDDDSGETLVELVLFPDPDGYFLFDTLGIIKTVFSNRVSDNWDYTPGAANDDDRLSRVINIDLSVNFSDDPATDGVTKTVTYVKGFEEADPNLSLSLAVSGTFLQRKEVLTPPTTYYWNGYPLDVAYINDADDYHIYRRNVSSGTEDDIDATVVSDLNLVEAPEKKGIYLKWFNNRGGYSYWLFDCVYQTEVDSNSVGSYQKPVINTGIGLLQQLPVLNESWDLGRTFDYSLTVNAFFNLEDRPVLSSLLYSDEVYFWNNVKGANAQDSADFFRRISLKKNKVEYNNKQSRFQVELELKSNFDIDLTKILG